MLPVPDGTVVTDDQGTVLADMVGAGTEMVIAEGGRGGLGNAALASSKRKAPGFALLGEPGDERMIGLELKVVADVGLVGYPSAGKSSLIAALIRARPKIADYPFTTLVPNLGVVQAGDTTFTVADVPGLIEGASEGRGLGHDFLRHVERCAAIVHVVDLATMEPGRNPMSDLDVIEQRARVVRRARRPSADRGAEQDRRPGRPRHGRHRQRGRAGPRLGRVPGQRGQPRGPARAVVRDGADGGRAARRGAGRGHRRGSCCVRRHQRHRPGVHGARDRRPVGRRGTTGWRVRGAKPERWIRQTDFSNDEAVGFLADRLNRLGVEAKLVALGAVEGDPVLIGDVATRWSSTSSPASTRVPRCSAAVARTSGSTRPVRQPSAAARSTRRCRSAARGRPAPTSRDGWDTSTGSDRRPRRGPGDDEDAEARE